MLHRVCRYVVALWRDGTYNGVWTRALTSSNILSRLAGADGETSGSLIPADIWRTLPFSPGHRDS